MPVIRINRPKDYVVMNKHLFREREMSLKAKGLLGLMLTLPEDYTYTVDNLVSLCKEGATAVESALSELKDFGYLVVTRLNPDVTESGRIEYIYNIYDTPQVEEASSAQETEIQGVEKQGVENHPLVFERRKEEEEAEERSGEEEKEESSIKKNKEEEGKKEDGEEEEKKKDCAPASRKPIEVIAQKGLFDDDLPVSATSSRKVKGFTPPTLDEVIAYCKQRNNNVDPYKFYDYYSAGDWMDGTNKPVHNWKQKMISVWERKSVTPSASFGSETPAPAKLPKRCREAMEELGFYEWEKYIPDFAEGAVALQRWHKETVKYDEHWICVYYPEDFWKSYLSFVFDMTRGRAPSNGHFLPGSNTHKAWMKEMEL